MKKSLTSCYVEEIFACVCYLLQNEICLAIYAAK